MINNNNTPRNNEKPNVNETPRTNETPEENENTFKLIERDYGTEMLREADCDSNQTLNGTLQCDFTEDFHKILVLNGPSTNHNIMLLDSTTKFGKLDSNSLSCSSLQESASSIGSNSCTNFSTHHNANILSTSSSSSIKSNSSRLINEVCALKECFKKIIADNQVLRFKLSSAIKRNESMEVALKSIAPFKCSSDGSIQFPGKKEMEKKILLAKTEISKLHAGIKEIQSIKQNLKSVKQSIIQYDSTSASCPCRNSFKNDTCDTNVKVKCQQIIQIESQIKQKKEELNKIKSDYESSVKLNHKTNAKCNKLELTLVDLKKKLQEYQLDAKNDILNNLDKMKEEIETMEYIIKERANLISDCDQKLEAVQLETKKITKMTDNLTNSLKHISNQFNYAYNEIELAYQEQSEEIIMLPSVLKVTHRKLQEEIDLRAMAEESKTKLERAIKNAEDIKKSVSVKDERADEEIKLLIAKLETENNKLEMRLESLDNKIKFASTSLSQETENLETIKKEVQDAATKSSRHVNAFDNFSIIHMDKIVKDVEEIQKLLIKLQSKECAKAIIKQKVMSHLRVKIDSIYQNVEECKTQIDTFKTNEIFSN